MSVFVLRASTEESSAPQSQRTKVGPAFVPEHLNANTICPSDGTPRPCSVARFVAACVGVNLVDVNEENAYLGRGTFGAVYLGTTDQYETPVVVKIVGISDEGCRKNHDNFLPNVPTVLETNLAEFKEEANNLRFLSQLGVSPPFVTSKICRLHECDFGVLVSQYVPYSIYDACILFSPEQVADAMFTTLGTLAKNHREVIDVHLENFQVDDSCRVFLIDVGFIEEHIDSTPPETIETRMLHELLYSLPGAFSTDLSLQENIKEKMRVYAQLEDDRIIH